MPVSLKWGGVCKSVSMNLYSKMSIYIKGECECIKRGKHVRFSDTNKQLRVVYKQDKDNSW